MKTTVPYNRINLRNSAARVHVFSAMKHGNFRNMHVWDRKEAGTLNKLKDRDLKISVNNFLKTSPDIPIIRPSFRSKTFMFLKVSEDTENVDSELSATVLD